MPVKNPTHRQRESQRFPLDTGPDHLKGSALVLLDILQRVGGL
jgi:hypothetical protein